MRHAFSFSGVFRAVLHRIGYRRRLPGRLAVLLLTAVTAHAGGNNLSRLLDSAGDFSPPFTPAGTVYSQSHRYPELLLWPQAEDPAAIVEVRANAGSFQRVATGRTLAVGCQRSKYAMSFSHGAFRS